MNRPIYPHDPLDSRPVVSHQCNATQRHHSVDLVAFEHPNHNFSSETPRICSAMAFELHDSHILYYNCSPNDIRKYPM